MTDVLIVAAWEPELCGHPGLVCGVGPVDAAAATAGALAAARPLALLHVGIAGAHRSSGVEPPQLVLGSVAIYEDLRLTTGLSPREVRPDEALLRVAQDVVPDAVLLPIGTTARVGGGSECPVEAMEGFAVLRAAALAGIPALELRAVSNLVEDARGDWRIDDALSALGRVLPGLIASLTAAVSPSP
jgi:futalosine hydrolase